MSERGERGRAVLGERAVAAPVTLLVEMKRRAGEAAEGDLAGWGLKNSNEQRRRRVELELIDSPLALPSFPPLFSSSLFHIDCFRCSKVRLSLLYSLRFLLELIEVSLRCCCSFNRKQCQDRVTADTNLLLLSDGNPVCSNCSYQVRPSFSSLDET